ncbi:hypothetical protein AK812_SmicGene14296 [Symbiodinium microadriaticum]|uniref:Uncharacterized protein n=1 Tax=Symbiodinium microadriaticum TaxID=2951 RepID=A0A1Q9E5W8_SYMMI|nr:hypothetical protein AK812_SmicGene14296 [Symbiodinium microadriaticum]
MKQDLAALSEPGSRSRPAATMELPLRRDSIRNGDDRVAAEPATVDAEKAPAAAEGPVMEVRALSAVAPAGRGTRATASCSRPGLPDPAIEGLGSPSRSGSAADTPTLHSKFEGSRLSATAGDGVKQSSELAHRRFRSTGDGGGGRRRGEIHEIDDLRERFRSFASGLASFGSPPRGTNSAGTPHSMSFTPLGRCFSAIQASPGGSVTLPSTPKRGVVIPAAGLSHTAGPRGSPSLSLFQPVVAGGSLAAPAKASSWGEREHGWLDEHLDE